MSIIVFSPAIGPVAIDCLLREHHWSEVEITENPIENGASVNDHAWVKPKRVSLEIADENAALSFNALVRFQESRVPFTLVTGLTVYENMLIQSIDATRDKDFSRVLRASVDLREVQIVSTMVGESGDGAVSTQNGRSAATPSKEKAAPGVTADRASSPVQRGDMPQRTVPTPTDRSILKGAFQ